METMKTNQTFFKNSLYDVNSTYFSFWTNMGIVPIVYDRNCFTVDQFHFWNITMPLYPLKDFEKLASICDIKLTIRRFAFYFSLIIGVPGNLFALLTMLKFPMTTGSFYLALLAGSDLSALLTKAINVGILTFQLQSDVSCKLITTLTSFTAMYANWVLVLICFERFVAIRFPLQKMYMFTLSRAYLSAFIISIILFPFASVYLFITTGGDVVCESNNEDLEEKWIHVTSVLYFYLPSFLLIVMVLLIWNALRRIQRSRRDTLCGDGVGSNVFMQKRLEDQTRMEQTITTMLLFAAITFIFLTLPMCVFIAVIYSEVVESSTWNDVHLDLVENITTGLITLSHAINFFVYFVSSGRFRSHLLGLLKCSRFKKKHCTQDTQDITLEQL